MAVGVGKISAGLSPGLVPAINTEKPLNGYAYSVLFAGSNTCGHGYFAVIRSVTGRLRHCLKPFNPPFTMTRPEILAPAGQEASFLAALAAGADAIYCGLKHFSARAEADNFSLSRLAALRQLAGEQNVRVYVALNTLIKPQELDKAGRLLDRLQRFVQPDAVIFSDPGLVDIARQAGLECELHLSTLGALTSRTGQRRLADMGVSRAVLPRELDIDEIRKTADKSPLQLEVFVHGALCYGVSGRCWWSSYLGGKSGLRGRCVQPCRRSYDYKGQRGNYFSCLDLELDVLVKTLLTVPNLSAWKIEGRKKGAHYVFYTTTAYRLLRDNPDDADTKKEAQGLLEQALGRKSTHYNFLPQRPFVPLSPAREPGSGRHLGVVKGSRSKSYINPAIQLLPGDLVRVGQEGETGHKLIKIKKTVPGKGRFDLPGSCRPGLPAFLIDRQETELTGLIQDLESKIIDPEIRPGASRFIYQLPAPLKKKSARALNLEVFRFAPRKKGPLGIHLSLDPQRGVISGPLRDNWYFLPPVIWPREEEEWQEIITGLQKKGARNFVLGSVWQVDMFKTPEKLNLWAGPYANIANPAALKILQELGFKGAVLSPELSREDFMQMAHKACIQVGIVIKGLWPVSISRTFAAEARPFLPFISPKKETFWAAKRDANIYIYPNWEINLTEFESDLRRAGFSLLLHLKEPLPRKITLKDRPGLWNWEQGLV
ncbi:peptidase U32 [Desulfonatronospira thiodismutans ASO3-1]|uniref:Peptidase U32 n=2 Tax=Desulfonatronospira thiodismutans TaxID=488939 RepID=D6SSA2_9BACT|nr:peptidase U32 [Desulfonatronospira thiodismutans ASO3-1]